MFMVLRKKQMIATAMVLMLGIAGYLNYRYDKDSARRGSLSALEDPAEPQVGEAVMVSTEPQTDNHDNKLVLAPEDPFAKERLQRRAAREKNAEELEALLEKEGTTPGMRDELQHKLAELTSYSEAEVTAESLLKSKGYKDTMVYITADSVTVTVKQKGISRSDTAKIVDVIFELTKNNNVKIVEVE